jgi:phosphoglycerate dehydrogenase-like enzyme
VLVPDEIGLNILRQGDGLHPELYVPSGGIEHPESVHVFIPKFLSDPTAADLSAMTDLKAVQLLTAGHDGWPERLPPGVSLCNGHGAHGRSTAEWVLAVTLAHLRGLPAFLDHQRNKEWRFAHTQTLSGAKILVLGAGDVAMHIRRLAEPFGADVTLVGRRTRPGVTIINTVHDALGSYDVIVLAIPYNADTHGLVDDLFLARLRPGALVVNAARGAIVDTDALLRALDERRIRAAIDVVDPEPLPRDHPLWGAPGLILTPHVGASVHGKLVGAYEVALNQILSLKSGNRPENLVSTDGRT